MPTSIPPSSEPDPSDAPSDAAVPATLQILDSVPDQTYEDFGRVAAVVCGASMAMVVLNAGEPDTFKLQVGVPPGRCAELFALCTRPVAEPGEISVEPAAGLGFFARVPLLGRDGRPLVTVCVFDDQSRQLDAAQLAALAALARQATGMLERRHKALQVQRLLAEREYLAGRMEGYQRELEQRNAELNVIASHDGLTGLLNRGALDALVEDPEAAARLFADYYSIAMIDVDHFKRVNDLHGHAAGDEVLRRIGAVIAECVRGSDVACRYGGEEFAVLMPLTHIAGARTVLERIRQAVQDFQLPFPVTLSAGLAVSRPGVDAPRQVFLQADQALYQAKHRGRNRIVAYED
jgi:diguanylate cyclase (GGDEF)-like protein